MLREDFMPDCGLTTAKLAESLGVSRQTINEILRERRAMTSLMALRLARLFGHTPESWLNARRACNLWQAEQACGQEIKMVP
jgi:addiction module HigA family antidote